MSSACINLTVSGGHGIRDCTCIHYDFQVGIEILCKRILGCVTLTQLNTQEEAPSHTHSFDEEGDQEAGISTQKSRSSHQSPSAC